MIFLGALSYLRLVLSPRPIEDPSLQIKTLSLKTNSLKLLLYLKFKEDIGGMVESVYS